MEYAVQQHGISAEQTANGEIRFRIHRAAFAAPGDHLKEKVSLFALICAQRGAEYITKTLGLRLFWATFFRAAATNKEEPCGRIATESWWSKF